MLIWVSRYFSVSAGPWNCVTVWSVTRRNWRYLCTRPGEDALGNLIAGSSRWGLGSTTVAETPARLSLRLNGTCLACRGRLLWCTCCWVFCTFTPESCSGTKVWSVWKACSDLKEFSGWKNCSACAVLNSDWFVVWWRCCNEVTKWREASGKMTSDGDDVSANVHDLCLIKDDTFDDVVCDVTRVDLSSSDAGDPASDVLTMKKATTRTQNIEKTADHLSSDILANWDTHGRKHLDYWYTRTQPKCKRFLWCR